MANGNTSLRFGPFQLDSVQGLMRDQEEIRVTPQSLGLLNYLAARAGQVVTKEELFQSIWRNRVVTDAALASCIQELRRALGDDARQPRYIETLYRRGYRFIRTVTSQADAVPATSPYPLRVVAEHAPELEKIRFHADRARQGTLDTVVLEGTAGAGKTTLVRTFLASLRLEPDPWWIGEVACIDGTGAGDAYRPVLELLGRIIEGPDGARASAILRDRAPSWLAELSGHFTNREAGMLRRQTSGVTSARRNRELREALVGLSELRPLVLVVDDLQFGDAATVEVLIHLAREGLDAGMLLIVTCSPGQLVHSDGLRELLESPACTLIEVKTTSEVEPRQARRVLAALTDIERRVLESASVAGRRFSEAEAAAGAEVPAEEADAVLMDLSRRETLIRLISSVNWPDGTSTNVFEFDHESTLSALQEAVPVPRRNTLHRRIGRRLQEGWSNATGDIAAQLAVHFELGGDGERALIQYYEAGVVARRRSAPQVAAKHFRRALALVPSLNMPRARNLWEADLQVAVGRELVIAEGLGSQAANEAFHRAFELQDRIDEGATLSRVLWGLWVYFLNRGPLENASRVAERLLERANSQDDPSELLQAHHAMWGSSLMLGDLQGVQEHTRQGAALCAAEAEAPLKMTTGCTLHDVHLNDHHAGVCAGFVGAWADALSGRTDTAARSLDVAVSHARDVDHPFTLAMTLVFAAGALAAAGDPGTTRRYSEEAHSIASSEGFGILQAWASIYEGWALACLGEVRKGLDKMRAGLDLSGGAGVTLFRPFQLALAANVQLDNDLFEEAARSLDEAFSICEVVGDRLALGDLHRIRGDLRLRTATDTVSRRRAANDLALASEIATEQGAEPLAARAATSLKKLKRRHIG